MLTNVTFHSRRYKNAGRKQKKKKGRHQNLNFSLAPVSFFFASAEDKERVSVPAAKTRERP